MKKLLLLLPLILLASVKVSVNKTHLIKGEDLIITITAEGKNVIFPNLNKIAGFEVIGNSESSNIVIINGNVKESVSKSYIIMPDRNFTIPSFSVSVNGKVFKTKPIHITVSIPKQTKGDYTLDINLSKTKAYLGEDLILTMKFQEKKPSATVNIEQPQIPNAIIKLIEKKETNNGVIYRFLVIPLKTGDYTIGPFIANIGEEVTENLFNDPFFTMKSIKYTPIYSNTLKLNVYPIPQNAVYGNFKINVSANNKIEADKPNRVLLKIKGCGDFNDLPEFHLNIPNATVYEKKPKINTQIKNNKLCGSFIKEFDVIAENNYTIPSFKLTEFDGHKTKTIFSQPLKVEVLGDKVENEKFKMENNLKGIEKQTISNHSHTTHSNIISYLLVLLIGIGMGAGGFLIYRKMSNSFFFKIKTANEKELINLLMPYSNHPKIREILNMLDENVYQNKNHKINKKEIIKIIKELKVK